MLNKESIKIKGYMPKIIAHRGASAYVPENTIQAIELSKKLGAKCVELDVCLTKYNEPVIIHDNNLKRTANVKGYVSSYSFKELLSFDVGSWFDEKFHDFKIPHFTEVINVLNEIDLDVNLELKPFRGNDKELVGVVLDVVNKMWPKNKKLPLLSSFSIDSLKYVKDMNDNIPLGFLVTSWCEGYNFWYDKLNCSTLHINFKNLKKKVMDELIESKKHVYAYTVNDTEKALELFRIGVSGIFTDYPDLLEKQ
jgi:glycerophosphoryl diester phosphodiesterase